MPVDGGMDSLPRSVGLAPGQFKEETPFVTLTAGLRGDLDGGHIEMPDTTGRRILICPNGAPVCF